MLCCSRLNWCPCDLEFWSFSSFSASFSFSIHSVSSEQVLQEEMFKKNVGEMIFLLWIDVLRSENPRLNPTSTEIWNVSCYLLLQQTELWSRNLAAVGDAAVGNGGDATVASFMLPITLGIMGNPCSATHRTNICFLVIHFIWVPNPTYHSQYLESCFYFFSECTYLLTCVYIYIYIRGSDNLGLGHCA